MPKTYAVLGSGMQGTAAAYDLALYGEAEQIFMGDISEEQAVQSSERVNRLVGRAVCVPRRVDALNERELEDFLTPADVVLSCIPYWMHPYVAPVAIRSMTSMVDMGGDTDVTLQTLGLDEAAKSANVSIVPDTGLAPGLVNSLATYLMERLDEVEDVLLYCGGLPQFPRPPFHYTLVFNIEGLVAEYTDKALAVREGKLVELETLTDLEYVEWEGIGKLEAFVTSGGTSTAPYTFEGKVRTYEYKTLRFPGHCEKMRVFMESGFWDVDLVRVDGCEISPRKVFYRVMEKVLRRQEGDKDQVLVRAKVTGREKGEKKTYQIDIHDKQDERTGFTAMERMTGFPTAIYAIEIARGKVPPGCWRYELAVPGGVMVTELKNRGIPIQEYEI